LDWLYQKRLVEGFATRKLLEFVALWLRAQQDRRLYCAFGWPDVLPSSPALPSSFTWASQATFSEIILKRKS